MRGRTGAERTAEVEHATRASRREPERLRLLRIAHIVRAASPIHTWEPAKRRELKPPPHTAPR